MDYKDATMLSKFVLANSFQQRFLKGYLIGNIGNVEVGGVVKVLWETEEIDWIGRTD